MHPKNLSIADYTYHLPDERIAKHPLAKRDQSKLLVYKSGKIEESTYAAIDTQIPAGSLLVFNNTKVVEARLIFKKETGALIEVFCLEPAAEYPDITTAMLQRGRVRYKALIGGASKWKHGMKLEKRIEANGEEIILEATIAERLPDCFVVELSWQPDSLSFAELLHISGLIPLPPYLHRPVEVDDTERYQTIYARYEGSVAAPTAGLHFTDDIFKKLAAKNIEQTFVTLHVGAGTFKPVKAETMQEHEMHAEFIDVSTAAIKQVISQLNETIIAVGTTSLRTIESLYWIGVKIINNKDILPGDIAIHQWEPYETSSEQVTSREALSSLLDWMQAHNMDRLITKTQILIAPGYRLKVAKAIITNFHQPHSTLLLLIAAIAGNEWKRIYEYAMNNDFRFLSYGDGCLLWPQDVNT